MSTNPGAEKKSSQHDVSEADLLQAIGMLGQSEQGRNTLQYLLKWLSATGIVLDAKNQTCVRIILGAVWGKLPGTVLDAIREELSGNANIPPAIQPVC